ncbi:MAG TPA: hypothetical protein VJ875_25465 [Pyrinomonadaceae bacterium]|nr:hypothetical protein [Pyrinomonadaceae bacterium]
MDRSAKSGGVLTASDDITRLTVNAFVSVLVALVLKTSLDSFFRNATAYNGVLAAVSALIQRGWLSLVLISQLVIFLFTLVRFYIGSFRYHQKEPEITSGPTGMGIDLLGAFGVFVSFYVAAVFIKTTGLFYFGFALIQVVDLLWFYIAGAYLNLSEGIQKVAAWYVFFDGITLVVLIIFFGLEYSRPWPSYFPQWMSLAAAFAIGIWDLLQLWPFYAGASDWSNSVKDFPFSRQMLTLGKRR